MPGSGCATLMGGGAETSVWSGILVALALGGAGLVGDCVLGVEAIG